MIIADSSAWIDFMRTPNRRLGPTVRGLLAKGELGVTGMVLTEVLAGLRAGSATEFAETLFGLPFVNTTKEAWIRAGRIAQSLEIQETRLALADAVIAASVIEGDHQLLTRDKHFDRIPGLKLYKWEDADA